MGDFYGPEDSNKHLENGQVIEDGTASLEPAELSDEEQDAVKKKIAAIDKLLGGKGVVAHYKIEVQFGKGRSTWKPFPGAISLYLSGTKLNGGGDEKLYVCPRQDCPGIIPPFRRFVQQTKDGRAVACVPCPKCGTMWPENDLVGEVFFRLAPPDWATVILRFFTRLENNADIYVKYHPMDIRAQTMMELARARGGEAINKARSNRGLHIYPLKNIIRDTGNGAQLYDRILAFIKA